MRQYLNLLQKIIDEGFDHPDRTGTGRRSIFGVQLRFNLQDGFPLVTTRKIFTRGIVEELLWFIRGSTNANELSQKGVKIWDQWKVREEDIDQFLLEQFGLDPADDESASMRMAMKTDLLKITGGSIGHLYGEAWRKAPGNNFLSRMAPPPTLQDTAPDKVIELNKTYQKLAEEDHDGQLAQQGVTCFEDAFPSLAMHTVDQLQDVMISLRDRPYSARHVINAWIPQWIPDERISPQMNVLGGRGALAPCHVLQQYFVSPPREEGGKKRLSLQLYQRSSDVPVGVPFNIAQYSILLSMIAQVLGYEPYEFIWTSGDTHVYMNQIELVKEQLTRDPKPLPKLWLNPEVKSIYDFKVDDIGIMEYEHHASMRYPVAT